MPKQGGKHLAALITLVERLALLLAVLCVAAIMFIVSYDAFSRYVFRAPLPWAFDVVSYYLLSASVFFAASAAFRSGDHINIDLFRANFRPAIRARIDAIWCLMASGAFAVMTYGAYLEAAKALRRGSFLTGYILWPAWIPYAVISVGCAILALRLVLQAVSLFVNGETEKNTPAEELHL